MTCPWYLSQHRPVQPDAQDRPAGRRQRLERSLQARRRRQSGSLRKTPIGIGVMQSISPSIRRAVISAFGKNGSFYVYDLATDAWKEQDADRVPLYNPTRVKDNKVWHVTATPVSTHGVTMFVKYFHTDPPRAWVYLYKHSDKAKKHE
jgi:hypothetical protein